MHIAPKAAQKASQHPTAPVRTASFRPRVTPQTQRGCAARCERTQPRAFFFSGRRGTPNNRAKPRESDGVRSSVVAPVVASDLPTGISSGQAADMIAPSPPNCSVACLPRWSPSVRCTSQTSHRPCPNQRRRDGDSVQLRLTEPAEPPSRTTKAYRCGSGCLRRSAFQQSPAGWSPALSTP